eukprot:gene26744-32315_t
MNHDDEAGKRAKFSESLGESLAALSGCLGNRSKWEVSEGQQKIKEAALLQMRRQSFGVDIAQLRRVHRTGQNLQATTSGWAYLGMYAFGDCTGVGFYTVGLATNVCLTSRPEENTTAQSFYYTCNDDAWTLQLYNNTNCDISGLVSVSNLNVSAPGVCGVYPPPNDDDDDILDIDDDSVNSTTSIYNALYSCIPGSTVNLYSNYVLGQYYATEACTAMDSFDGPLDGGCFPTVVIHTGDDDGGGTLANASYSSLYTKYPTESFFYGPNCTGEPYMTRPLDTLSEICTRPHVDFNDLFYDDQEDNIDGVDWWTFSSALTCTVPENTDCSSDNNDDSLSDGAIAGIVVGSVAGAALIGVGAYAVVYGGQAGSVGMASQAAAPAANAV